LAGSEEIVLLGGLESLGLGRLLLLGEFVACDDLFEGL
jgi:hypothetical protein